MKKAWILIAVLIFAFGCTAEKPLEKPVQNLMCCNRTIAEKDNKCELINPPENFSYTTGGCNLTKNICNINITSVQKGGTNKGGSSGIGGIGNLQKTETINVEVNTIEVPICSGVTENKCVQSNCTAMVCGDFIYRPEPLPSLPTEEEIEAGAALPATTSKEKGFSLYKADCKFLPMDENLSKILERTGSLVNSFRFGIGSQRPNFEDFEAFRNYFPPSDKFCSANPTGGKDRYMNYLEICAINGSGNSIALCQQLKYTPTDPTESISKYQCIPYTVGLSDDEKMVFRKLYPFLYVDKESNEDLQPSGYKLTPEGLFDKAFYARALTAQYYDMIFVQNKSAPFECSRGDCLSGYCNTQDYKRTTIVKKVKLDGQEIEEEVPVDCYYGTINGRRVVACASHSAPPELRWDSSGKVNVYPNYQEIPVYVYDSGIIRLGYMIDTEKEVGYFREAISGNWESENLSSLSRKCYEKKEHDENYGWNDNPITLLKEVIINSVGIYVLNIPYYCHGQYICIEDCPPVCLVDPDEQPLITSSHNFNFSIKSIPKDFFATLKHTDENDNCQDGYEKISWLYYYKKGCNDGWCYSASLDKGKNQYPPAATIYFFNNPNLGVVGKKVIGYGTGRPEDSDFVKKCNMKEGKDYDVIDLVHPSYELENAPEGQIGLQLAMDNIRQVMPYYNGSDERFNSFSFEKLSVASLPWALAHKPCENCGIVLAKPEYQVLAQNNVFNLEYENLKTIRSSEELALEAGKGVSYVLVSRYYYIIYSLGDCEMEEGTELPKLKTYGWCEPCTYATMAYTGAPSLPQTAEDDTNLVTKSNPQIVNYLKNGILPIIDFRKQAETIDMSQCSVDMQGNIQSCSSTAYPWIGEMQLLLTFEENDIKKEGIGPVIVLVGSQRTKYMADPSTAIEQASYVKANCKKCLAAVPFYASSDSYASEVYSGGAEVALTNYVDEPVLHEMFNIFNNSVKINDKDVQGKDVIDVAVVEFPIADVMSDYAKDSSWNSKTAKEKADLVVERMYNYAWSINDEARKAGKTQPVPVVILFNLESNESKGWWVFNSKDDNITEENKRRNYADFFSNIYLSRDKLRKAGIIGLVYTPISAKGHTMPNYTAQLGIVNLPRSFGSKFCSFQEGSYDFISVSLLNKVSRISQSTAEKCNIFGDQPSIQLNQTCALDSWGWTDYLLNCTLTCYNETDSCSLMCKMQNCTAAPSDEDHQNPYLVCEPPLPITTASISCMFKNAKKIGENYEENTKCTIKSPSIAGTQQRDCTLSCREGRCNFDCSPDFGELIVWKNKNCYIDRSPLKKICENKTSPTGALYCEECLPNEYCDNSTEICDDGTRCVPLPATTGPYKCPKNVVSANCPLCSEKTDSLSCLMRRYTTPKPIDRFAIAAGGSYDSYFKKIKYSTLNETDAEVIARIPTKDKCCLVDENGTRYTFKLEEMNAVSTTPVIFATGQPSPQMSLLQDCGFIDPTIIDAQGGIKICGVSTKSDDVLACKKEGEWLTYSK